MTVFNRGITTYGVDHELYYNKARQQAITSDMLDIAGGAEALAQASRA